MPSPSAFRDTQSILERFFREGAYQRPGHLRLEHQRPQSQGGTDCVGKTQELKRENLRCLGQSFDIEPASGASEAIILA